MFPSKPSIPISPRLDPNRIAHVLRWHLDEISPAPSFTKSWWDFWVKLPCFSHHFWWIPSIFKGELHFPIFTGSTPHEIHSIHSSDWWNLHPSSFFRLIVGDKPVTGWTSITCQLSSDLDMPLINIRPKSPKFASSSPPDSPPPDIQDILATTGWLEDCWCSFPRVPGILGASESWISFDLCRHRTPPDHRNHVSRQDSA